MSLSQNFDWYQDANYVTASVKIAQKNLKNYRAEFTDTGFSVYADGQFVYIRTYITINSMYVSFLGLTHTYHIQYEAKHSRVNLLRFITLLRRTVN